MQSYSMNILTPTVMAMAASMKSWWLIFLCEHGPDVLENCRYSWFVEIWLFILLLFMRADRFNLVVLTPGTSLADEIWPLWASTYQLHLLLSPRPDHGPPDAMAAAIALNNHGPSIESMVSTLMIIRMQYCGGWGRWSTLQRSFCSRVVCDRRYE